MAEVVRAARPEMMNPCITSRTHTKILANCEEFERILSQLPARQERKPTASPEKPRGHAPIDQKDRIRYQLG
jgi:hypothetical protein